MSELKKRLSVAVWGIPLLLFACYMSGYYFLALLLFVNTVALWEFYSIQQNHDIYPMRKFGIIASNVMLVCTLISPAIIPLLCFFFVILTLLFHLKPQQGIPSTNTSYTLTGVIYISLFLCSLLHLSLNFAASQAAVAAEQLHAGGRLVIIMFLSIWACDTAAYFGGKRFGKHKLAPQISPNKTIEGGVAGLITAIVVFVGVSQFLLPALPSLQAAMSGAVVGIFGQVGDLVESRFKRNAGVKDTGTLLPGHGGIYDRFDSIIYVSPFLWIQYVGWGMFF